MKSIHHMDTRRQLRQVMNTPVRVYAEDEQGDSFCVKGVCLDISHFGLRIRLREPIERRSYVCFQIECLSLSGSGIVRHCTRDRMHYVVGLEFCGGLSWDLLCSEKVAAGTDASGEPSAFLPGNRRN